MTSTEKAERAAVIALLVRHPLVWHAEPDGEYNQHFTTLQNPAQRLTVFSDRDGELWYGVLLGDVAAAQASRHAEPYMLNAKQQALACVELLCIALKVGGA